MNFVYVNHTMENKGFLNTQVRKSSTSKACKIIKVSLNPWNKKC